MSVADERLLEKVARSLKSAWAGGEAGAKGSILGFAAGAYGARPATDETTIPTGFDPRAAALFEAIVEAAYLVATADGNFDDAEREAFARVVSDASGGALTSQQLYDLLGDLGAMLEEDGLDARVTAVVRAVNKPEHKREILRVAGLLAHVSSGVSAVERDVLQKLAAALHLDAAEVDSALDVVKSALA